MSSNLKRAATSAITPSGKKIPKLTTLTTPLPVANLFGSGSASLAGVIPVDCDNSPCFPLPCSQTEFSPFDYSPFGIYCQSCVQTLVLSPENEKGEQYTLYPHPKPKLSSPVGMYVKWYKAEEQFSMLKSNILG